MNNGKLKRIVLAVFSSREQGMFPMPRQEGIFAQSEAALHLCIGSPGHTTPGWQSACKG